MAPPAKQNHLLEITIMSAQDLQPVAKKMKTYATAWLHDTRKLSTRIDDKGNSNPTWNDKFVFRVDDDFLFSDASALTIEIFSTHWLRDSVVGKVRVLVSNLIPPPELAKAGGVRCVALQVRRPSGRTQGVLTVEASVLDRSMRSLPLYRQLDGSAVGFPDLMGMEDDESEYNPKNPRLKLFRSRSERSSRFEYDSSVANSSVVAPPLKIGKPGSILSESELWASVIANGKLGKLSSGEEPQEQSKPNGIKIKRSNSVISSSTFNGSYVFRPPPKPCSVLSGLEVEPHEKSKPNGIKLKRANSVISSSTFNGSYVLRPPPKPYSMLSGLEVEPHEKSKPNGIKLKRANSVNSSSTFNANYVFRAPPKPYSMLSGSEIAPASSDAMATMGRAYPLEDDMNSSVLDSWSIDESEEGLRSKLDRWRSELPPFYDARFSSSNSSTTSWRKREQTDVGDNRTFSIFGNICGYECQCVCGQPQSAKSHNRLLRSSSSLGSSRSSSNLSS